MFPLLGIPKIPFWIFCYFGFSKNPKCIYTPPQISTFSAGAVKVHCLRPPTPSYCLRPPNRHQECCFLLILLHFTEVFLSSVNERFLVLDPQPQRFLVPALLHAFWFTVLDHRTVLECCTVLGPPTGSVSNIDSQTFEAVSQSID